MNILQAGYGRTSAGRNVILSKHLRNILPRQLLHNAFFRYNKFIGKLQLLLLQLKDFFFYRVPGNKLVGKYFSLLADTVCTINRLSLNRWVPPMVKNEHVI